MPKATTKQKSLSKSPAKPSAARRSPCPVACGLDLFGDRWTLLIIRDLIFGGSRFKDFLESPEGVPTNILSDRLERLLAGRIVIQVPAKDGTKHLGYALTEKGQALAPVLAAIRDWGLKWQRGTKVGIQTKATQN